MLLWSTLYSAPFWLTYKQAQELSGTVLKGEKGHGHRHRLLQTTSWQEGRRGKQTGERGGEQIEGQDRNKGRTPFVLTSYTVFNVEH